ncbi:MFS general substrate transporter [Mycena sp. CBHHK59/15]|nr:MFS general substrate transporter [Mycena sp. CBHHK59/15]
MATSSLDSATATSFGLAQNSANSVESAYAVEIHDIEHVPVADDPRQWSNVRKNIILIIIALASMVAGLGANILNPSIEEIQSDLHASAADFSWSISIYILIQGSSTLLWSAVSEIGGRKFVYLVSLGCFTVGSIITANAKNMGILIGFRCLQGAGSSVVLTIGAASLADIFEPSERGTKMGIYYAAPLLGPSIGPIVGGALTAAFNWRASFWFLAIFGGLNFLSFLLLFKETFRRERSAIYQRVLRQRLRYARSVEQPALSVQPKPEATSVSSCSAPPSVDGVSPAQIRLSWRDVNPIRPAWHIIRRKNNVAILCVSGVFFAFSYCIVYTCSRTLSAPHYGYNSVTIGLVLLAFGIGSFTGSVLGGRWSDLVLRRLKAANGNRSCPEMRLQSTQIAMCLLPCAVAGFGWVSERHLHVSTICVMLFLCGLFSIWAYSSIAAYLVDANNGCSAVALACNSTSRGIAAFALAEAAVPWQDEIGDGWSYTVWAGMFACCTVLVFWVISKGEAWKEEGETKDVDSEAGQK